ncbi:unnamed protein product [Didymodactylos carnosus]|uniref:Uncharacterized protein n=1 Tax=Didymodactylos carnosus TaxID=1234261 RepID=A0A815U461_9BILA|nr:unnamed protein product [Didymodactylos carnosus]CAF1514633.1 unnamed protein product [Didymodactylos carnosus]CAF3985035.1 unnamed protein product [Didymodactylos carnosus]CAF4374803.1 unnamed protein product [Didymodactylos carnosus]
MNSIKIKNSGSGPIKVGLFKNLGDFQPSFDAEKIIDIGPGASSEHVQLAEGWEGRAQKLSGKPEDPATWLEFHFNAWQDMTFADISLIRGYNGAAKISSEDGTANRGFSQDLYGDAPEKYKMKDSNGTPVLAATEPYTGGRNDELVAYYRSKVENGQAWMDNTDKHADRGTVNKQLNFEFF